LSARNIRFGLEQSTEFIPTNLKTKFFTGAVLKKDAIHLESKSVLKWRLPNLNNVFLYLGFKYSMDGPAFLAGIKVAGVKMLFPLMVLNPVQVGKRIAEDLESSFWEVIVCHLISSSLIGWWNRR